jgi:hypothetical protein
MPRVTEANLTPVRSKILRAFVGKFEWVPYWHAEVTLAVESLENRLLTAERYAGSAALRSHLSEAHKYRQEAFSDHSILRGVMTGQHRFEPVNFKTLREDEFVERALAKHLLFSQSLVHDKWPVHQGRRFARSLRPYTIAIRDSDPGQLTTTFYDAYTSTSARDQYWTMQTRNAWLDPRIQRALKTVHQSPQNGEMLE